MVTGVLLVTLGAVKNPLLEIAPALAVQVTAVFGLPLMRAVNCNCCCDATVAVSGETETAVEALEVAGVAGPEDCEGEQAQAGGGAGKGKKNGTKKKNTHKTFYPPQDSSPC